ncbi:MAG: glycine C-acetyltransferase, partial [FCB group bacterium]|nr:glycine C-acetyltransferase [FCB group bacterium]
ERVIVSEQGAEITVEGGKKVLNFCANNYLGLSGAPWLREAAEKTLKKWGYGMSSVRFICGTQSIHKELEKKVSEFLGTEDTILYAACFDANGGVFEPFLDKECAIITDALNHASIIDGIRLCKAARYIYKHADMAELEEILKKDEVKAAKYRMIATDGVFSMDGDIAKLDKICDLGDKYDALTLVDDSHSSGFMGKTGRGTHEYRGVMGRVDLITTTFGKALGGASGGCTSGRAEMIEYLRQKSRPYLFSNTLAPSVVGATIAVFDKLSETTELRDKLERNTKHFRKGMTDAGFKIVPGDHPIVPIMFGHLPNDAALANQFADELLQEGIYVIGFSYPVVPRGQARIRVQVSAGHEKAHLDKAISAFTKIGKKLKVIE